MALTSLSFCLIGTNQQSASLLHRKNCEGFTKLALFFVDLHSDYVRLFLLPFFVLNIPLGKGNPFIAFPFLWSEMPGSQFHSISVHHGRHKGGLVEWVAPFMVEGVKQGLFTSQWASKNQAGQEPRPGLPPSEAWLLWVGPASQPHTLKALQCPNSAATAKYSKHQLGTIIADSNLNKACLSQNIARKSLECGLRESRSWLTALL